MSCGVKQLGLVLKKHLDLVLGQLVELGLIQLDCLNVLWHIEGLNLDLF